MARKGCGETAFSFAISEASTAKSSFIWDYWVKEYVCGGTEFICDVMENRFNREMEAECRLECSIPFKK